MTVHKSIYTTLESPGLPYFLSRSAYSIEEIKATLDRGEKLEAKYQELLARVYKLTEGMGFIMGYDTPKHKALIELSNKGSFYLEGNNKGAHEPFPVATWVVKLDKQQRFNVRLEKAIEELEK